MPIETRLERSSKSEALIEVHAAALNRAAKRSEVIVLCAHNISDEGPNHYLCLDVREKILVHSVAAGLAFCTYDDLP